MVTSSKNFLNSTEIISEAGKLSSSSKKLIGQFDVKSLKIADYFVLSGTFALMFFAAFLVYQLQPYFEQVHLERMESAWGPAVMYTTFSLLALKVAFLIYVLVLHFKYKPVQSVSDDDLPTTTVIVPAYNEGELVYHTLISLIESDFPKEKLELLAIDDGSKDDTWEWMQKAKAIIGDCLTIYQQPKNMGKRHALYRGFKLGAGEIFVTVDSDSVVKKDTLRNMVSPFVVNEKCGAVAGNVRVLNNNDAIIPRMLNVSFTFSFEFVRSAQSVLGSVMCTPGALSAYRKEAVLACLDEWLHQTFMGKPSDIGEDRAMTNMILKQGFHVLFQRNAFVYTNTPEKYKNLYKMFIRWERSNVRENIAMSKFAFGNFRQGPKTGTRLLLLDQWLKVILSYPLMALMFVFIFTHPVLFFSSILVSILVFSSVQAIFYAKRHNLSESFWAYPYSIFYTFALFWITPYAILTAGRGGWLTR
ncbi:glycosyltransferase [Polluticaenibacter yanchengensis]|uniref:Glycosyltransferase family 2 protein n=1 Tax=Polluticaenibacter yanchengensis TaxID=3014562 RepID=A0ABT4UG82_9BACT|nr:glycosyltransferase family 2 protein [Chitinophagaceae bacterium LY-5]